MPKFSFSLLNLSSKTATLAVLSSVLLTACQSTPTNLPVIQRPNNVFETTGLGKTSTIAKTNAINYATQQCRNHSPIVLSDTTKYNGVLDEGLGRIADQAMGVIGGIFGNKASIARDDDYEYTITFRCP
ncbi:MULTISPECIES: hypothetical protein [unclassified Moraxella]|uniref:hypothetical protein n=1 Tax=unclassified Moraxella TaxID=2685852 RepID=UPI003AF7B37B